ncbi:hypothetical protein BV501_08245 [Erwinia sp. OAMSP11]|nr:hypothetical protein BV501_08245 [Erwinia sp. OAMSP11]PIJ72585.1 hypothetical protein BK416_08845 [Erwinia sp. OLSSP12]PIJ82065.1 hypothetical protein BLD47_06970 [Erwinia sp. OLCASP19]
MLTAPMRTVRDKPFFFLRDADLHLLHFAGCFSVRLCRLRVAYADSQSFVWQPAATFCHYNYAIHQARIMRPNQYSLPLFSSARLHGAELGEFFNEFNKNKRLRQ